MPERICRSAPVPSSRVKRSSLSDFLTASQALTLTARKSLLLNVSKSTGSSARGSVSTAGFSGACAAFWSSSSAASSFAMSMRGKRGSPPVTAASALSTPNAARESQPDSDAPMRRRISAEVAGMGAADAAAMERMTAPFSSIVSVTAFGNKAASAAKFLSARDGVLIASFTGLDICCFS